MRAKALFRPDAADDEEDISYVVLPSRAHGASRLRTASLDMRVDYGGTFTLFSPYAVSYIWLIIGHGHGRGFGMMRR